MARNDVVARSATQTLARFAAETRFEQIPEDVRSTVRALLLDSIGCAFGGTAVDKGRIAICFARALGESSDCTVVGGAHRASAVGASFANGELINALDMDAILTPGHITPYVVPSVLAFAELRSATGKELLRALAVAHEIGARVSAAGNPLRELRGTPPNVTYELSPTTGYGSCIIGAAAGAALLLGFSVPQIESCFGVAGYMTPVPGLGKYLRLAWSPHVKYTSAGWVAAGATAAAQLVGLGYTGDPSVLDGDYGLVRMFASSSCDWNVMVGDLGTRWRTLESEIKPYPSFRMGHPAIEVFVDLLRAERLDPERIESVTVTVDPVSMSPLYLNTELRNHTDAQLSWAYVLAAAAYHEPGPRWQSADAMNDPRVGRLMHKVKVEKQQAWAGELYQQARADASVVVTPFSIPVEVSVRCNGRTYAAETVPYPKGHPKRPMTADEVAQKFLRNAREVLAPAAAERLCGELLAIDGCSNVAAVLAGCAARP